MAEFIKTLTLPNDNSSIIYPRTIAKAVHHDGMTIDTIIDKGNYYKADKVIKVKSESLTPELYLEHNRFYEFINPITNLSLDTTPVFDNDSICMIRFTAGTTITVEINDLDIKGLVASDFQPNKYHEIIFLGKVATIKTI